MITNPPREVVKKLLSHYDLEVKHIVVIPYCNEHVFRIISADGKSYRMRIREHEDGAHREMRSHMDWLCTLNKNTDLRIPKPLPLKNGDLVKRIRLPSSPMMYHCSIVSWMPGYVLGKRPTKQGYFKLGHAVARLHGYSENLRPLPKLNIPTEIGCWVGDGKRHFLKSTQPFLERIPNERRGIFEEAVAEVMGVLREMRRSKKQLSIVHGDLHSWNASIHQGEACLFDFESLKWGHFIQDIALWQHREYYQDWLSGHSNDLLDPEALALTEAFRDGYSNCRTWPGEDSRQLNALTMRYVLEHARDFRFDQRKEGLRKAELALRRLMESQ